LIDQFGQEGFEQIDGLLNSMRSVAETCPFLLIVGDWDIVPPGGCRILLRTGTRW